MAICGAVLADKRLKTAAIWKHRNAVVDGADVAEVRRARFRGEEHLDAARSARRYAYAYRRAWKRKEAGIRECQARIVRPYQVAGLRAARDIDGCILRSSLGSCRSVGNALSARSGDQRCKCETSPPQTSLTETGHSLLHVCGDHTNSDGLSRSCAPSR